MDFLLKSFILDKRPFKEYDLIIDFFTKEFGRLEAKIISGQKINSKLSPHIEVGKFSLLKIVFKKEYKIIDAKEINNYFSPKSNSSLGIILKFTYFLREMIPFQEPDLNLFHFIENCFKNKVISYPEFLSILGYNPAFSVCSICQKPANFFFTKEQVFLCSDCRKKVENEVLLEIKNEQLE